MPKNRLPYRIFIADDMAETASHVKRVLEDEGYNIIAASAGGDTPELAARILNETYVHAAIIDYRLRNEYPSDHSGLKLVETMQSPLIRIVYTAWKHQIDHEKYQARVDEVQEKTNAIIRIIQKETNTQELLTRLAELLQRYVPLNHDLVLRVLNQQDFVSILRQTFPDFDYGRAAELNHEVQDVFRLTFHKSWIPPIDPFVQVDIEPLPGDCTGLRWLKINGYTLKGREVPHIALFGHPDLVVRYKQLFEQYPLDARRDVGHFPYSVTLHYGLLVFPLNDHRENFAELYSLRDYLEGTAYAEPSNIGLMLNTQTILQQLKASHHQVPSDHELPYPFHVAAFPHDLAASFNDRLEKLIQPANTLLSVQIHRRNDGTFEVRDSVNHDSEDVYVLPDMSMVLPELEAHTVQLPRTITYGALGLDTILTGNQEGLYILGSGCIGARSCLYDFVTLELSIRRSHIAPHRSLKQQFAFEQGLLGRMGIIPLKNINDTDDLELNTLYRLRTEALAVTDQQPTDYLRVFALYALQALTQAPLDLPFPDNYDARWGLHCWLAAACNNDPRIVSNTLLLSSNRIIRIANRQKRQVQIGNQTIKLSLYRFEVFLYLFQHYSLSDLQKVTTKHLDVSVLSPLAAATKSNDKPTYVDGSNRVHKMVYDLNRDIKKNLNTQDPPILVKNDGGYFLWVDDSYTVEK